MPTKPKRVNKSKQQVEAEMAHYARVGREKQLVKLMYPFIKDQDTIYNAQTAVAAASGFIKAAVDRKAAELKVQDLAIDLSKEPESPLKASVVNLLGLLEPENAKDMASLLERFANILAQYSANEFMKQPMTAVSIDKIIAE